MQCVLRLTSAALLLGPLALVTGCARDANELKVLCGSSFRDPMEKLVEMYEKETGKPVGLEFGGSEDHLPKVKTKSIGDAFVTHSPYMQYTKEADALLREVEVGFLAPVLVVRKDYPQKQKLKTIEDLARPELLSRVVLPNPKYSTCGEMVSKLLKEKGIKDGVMKNVGNDLVKHHSEVGNQLKIGARDAGIMWNGVAHNYLDSLEIVPTEYEYDQTIRVAVIGLSYSRKQEQLKEFLDFVEKHGKEVFTEFGYVKQVKGD